MPSVSYLPTQSDLLAATRLNHWASLFTWRVGAFLVIYAIFAFAVVQFSGGTTQIGLLFGAAAIVFFVLVLAASHVIRPRMIARRQFAEQRNLRDAYIIEWSAAGYAIRGPTVTSEVPWSHYVHWREDRNVILLYPSRYMYQFIPRRLLPPGAEEQIREYLQTAGVKQARFSLFS